MKFSVKVDGMAKVQAHLEGVSRQIPFITARALTRVAHLIRAALIAEMARVLDRPTNYALRQAMQVIPASKQSLEAAVGLGIKVAAPAKGTPYIKALGHLFNGGTREWKRMEGAFRGAGILPNGMMMVPASDSWAMTLDANGNAPRGQIVQLLSYFRAFGEQGFKANMTDRRRKSLAKVAASAAGYKTINGVMYFVSHGKARDQHLHAGIWAKRGTHGSDVAPVFVFVRRGRWRQLINIEDVAKQVIASHWVAELDKSLSDSMRTAR